MDARVGTDIALLEEKRNKGLEQIERQKKKVREDLAYIRSNKLTLLKTGVYTPESLIEEENKLNKQLAGFQEQEQVSDEAMHETMKDIQKLSELVKNVVPYYQFANPQEKEQIARVIFSELYVSENTLEYKVKNGFECFENRFQAICDPTGNPPAFARAGFNETSQDQKRYKNTYRFAICIFDRVTLRGISRFREGRLYSSAVESCPEKI